jgi:hypothetical protein
VNAATSAAIWSVESPASAQDAHDVEVERRRQLANVRLIAFDEIGAGLRVLIVPEAIADGPHAATDTVARFNESHRGAVSFQISRRGQTCETRSCDDYRRSGKEIARHQCFFTRVR